MDSLGVKPLPRPVNTKLPKHRLELPVADPNTEALGSFMRECLVPLLAKEFLARRVTTSPTPNRVKAHKSTFRPLGKEGGRIEAVMKTIE